MQRILDPDRLLGLLTTDIPAEMRAPGTWMHDALTLRDRWESMLLRTAPWSPRPRFGRWRCLMLFVHEVHEVAGAREDEFEAAFRERLDAAARRGRRRPPALVHEPRARQRRVVQRRHDHRRARRRGVGTPGAPRADRRPARVVA